MGDKGEHDFVYSIYPHAGDWRTGDTVREAYALNAPLCAGKPGADGGDGGAARLAPFGFARSSRPDVIVDTLKGAEDGDGLILRVYEAQGARGDAEVDFGLAPASAAECNLMEDYERDVPVSGGKLRFYIKPYEIKTFRLRF